MDLAHQDHWITASVYQNIPFIDDFNVCFTRLPPGVYQRVLDKFGQSEGTMLERPNHQAPECGIPAVHRTLADFDKITRFKVIPPPYKDGVVRVVCQFESPVVACTACKFYQVKQHALNIERISVHRVLSVLGCVPRAKFDLIERDLLHLQEKVWDHTRDAHLKILPPYEGEAYKMYLVQQTLIERLHATNSVQIQRGPAASAGQREVKLAGSA